MEIGIIGLPQSGKTAVYNVLTGGAAADTPAFSGSIEPNIAMVKVPDPRLDRLAAVFSPKKITPATFRLVDVAGVPKAEDGAAQHGLPEALVRALLNCDALLAVVRAFPSAGGEAPDPMGDIEALNLELLISDLQKVENRLERIDKQIKRPVSPERAKLEAEQAVLLRAKAVLEKNEPLRQVEFTPDEEKMMRGFLFLSQKPIYYLINVDEDAMMSKPEAELLAAYAGLAGRNSRVGLLCAKIESEIASLSPEEQKEFLSSFSIAEPAFGKIIQGCYDVMGYISFLTAGEPEVRAWPIPRGATAPEAAGTIHGDLQKGFVRAEVVNVDDLVRLGSFAEARKHGILRTEGKAYVVQDNDVMHILHNK